MRRRRSVIPHEKAKGMKSDYMREEKLRPVRRMVCSAPGDSGADCARTITVRMGQEDVLSDMVSILPYRLIR